MAVVNPDNGQLIQRIYLTAGTSDSVAVSPDGSRLYVGVVDLGPGAGLRPAQRHRDHLVHLAGTDSGGNLVATSGGVWGTTGIGTSEWTWFAPNGDLARAVRSARARAAASPRSPATAAASSGSAARTRWCARARSTGHVLDTVTLPTDHGVVEYFASPVVSGGRAYSYYPTTRPSSPAWSA